MPHSSDSTLPRRKLRWMPLDNAAKIYPASGRRDWSNVFRLSATLTEPVEPTLLQSALDVTVRRFPLICARLRRGVFWYYLQQLPQAPRVQEEHSYPLSGMSRREVRRCAFRVLYYERRIAVEFFHSLTDGTGGMIFLKTLLAEYLQQAHGLSIPNEEGVLSREQEPTEAELEDSFQRHCGPVSASRRDTNAWHLSGTPEPDGFLNLTCFQLPVKAVMEQAHAFGVSVTAFLGAVMMKALLNLQEQKVPNCRRRKPVKVLLPVNLRNLFPSCTLRNFAMYVIPSADPRLGSYTLQELCAIVRHKMGLEITPKHMSAMITCNVSSERLPIVKVLPLFMKTLVMKAVFHTVGERKSCLSLSNLGQVRLPKVMEPWVQRLDFILGVQARAPHNCGVLSWNDTLYLNFIRNIREPELEASFFAVLRDLGLPVLAESNQS